MCFENFFLMLWYTSDRHTQSHARDSMASDGYTSDVSDASDASRDGPVRSKGGSAIPVVSRREKRPPSEKQRAAAEKARMAKAAKRERKQEAATADGTDAETPPSIKEEGDAVPVKKEKAAIAPLSSAQGAPSYALSDEAVRKYELQLAEMGGRLASFEKMMTDAVLKTRERKKLVVEEAPDSDSEEERIVFRKAKTSRKSAYGQLTEKTLVKPTAVSTDTTVHSLNRPQGIPVQAARQLPTYNTPSLASQRPTATQMMMQALSRPR